MELIEHKAGKILFFMAIVQVTAGDCKTIAESLREHLGRLGVRMNIRGELYEFLDDLTWLGTFPADTDHPRAAFEVDPARAARAFPRYEQALRIARAIVFIEDSPAARGRARLLKDFDRLRSLAETSQDALFELEVAGRFLWKRIPLSLDEPDLVLLPGTLARIGIACKRPRHRKRLHDCVRRAANQIRRSPPGVIAIGVEALLQRDEATGRPIVFQTNDQEELREYADDAVKQLAEECRVELKRVFTKDESLIGVIFCGVITAWSAKPSAYLYNWVHHTIANERLEDAAPLLATIDSLMFGDGETGEKKKERR